MSKSGFVDFSGYSFRIVLYLQEFLLQILKVCILVGDSADTVEKGLASGALRLEAGTMEVALAVGWFPM